MKRNTLIVGPDRVRIFVYFHLSIREGMYTPERMIFPPVEAEFPRVSGTPFPGSVRARSFGDRRARG